MHSGSSLTSPWDDLRSWLSQKPVAVAGAVIVRCDEVVEGGEIVFLESILF